MTDDIELTPRYSTREIAGRCIKCLAEEKYRHCVRELLESSEENKKLEGEFEHLVSLLQSPELKKLCDESEKLLADGEDVTVVLHLGEEEPRYEIRRQQTG